MKFLLSLLMSFSWLPLQCSTATSYNSIEGMLYYDEVSPSHLELLKVAVNALNPSEAIQWQDKSGLRRQTFEFGISFKEIEQTGRIIKRDVPSFLIETRNALVKLFNEHLTEKNPEKYENCILTVYLEGDGIKAHTDREYFGPDILGLIVQPDSSTTPEKVPSTLRFFNPTSNEQISLVENEGTAFLFQGVLRKTWKHELAGVASKRIAIQFRTVNKALIPDKISNIPKL